MVLYTVCYNYDSLDRLISSWQKIGDTVSSYTYYSYDAIGNITAITSGGTTESQYTYDSQGQLLTETIVSHNLKFEYTYDNYGNIDTVTKKNLSTGAVIETYDYTYGNTSWLDQLTAYNGTPITYDNIGNPLSYYNGSAYTFTWKNGRELATAVKDGVTTSYQYGADGLRVQKTVGSVVYNYYYSDGMLVRQTWGSNYIDFLCDESGLPYSFVYNGTQYYYVKNLQGDVVAIADASGSIVVNYAYDAWGNVLSMADTSGNDIGTINPIRYRSYYYDTDTGFYYLQSRYYDPAIRRFINADDVSLLGVNGDFASLNLYAYCGNNPVARADDGGEFWNLVIGAAVGGIIGGLASAASQLLEDSEAWKTKQFWGRVGIASAAGAVTGLVAATGVGLLGQVAWNAGTAAVSSVLDTAIATEGKASLTTYAINATESAVFGTVAGFLGGKGSGTNHLSSAWNRVWHNHNFSYYFTQVNVESVKSGVKAIPAILKGIIPSMSKATIKKLNSLD